MKKLIYLPKITENVNTIGSDDEHPGREDSERDDGLVSLPAP